MTLLQFILLELIFLFRLRFLNRQFNPFLLLFFLYPIWIAASFLFCLEIIPYDPEFPRFNGLFDSFSDYLCLLFFLGVGLYVIPITAYLTEKIATNTSVRQIKRGLIVLIITLSLFCFWGWLGVFNTPNLSTQFFIKSNPTFKFTFRTQFDKPVTWKEKEKLESVQKDKLNEELKFMQYVSNKGNWK
jgi:hypothetical protein